MKKLIVLVVLAALFMISCEATIIAIDPPTTANIQFDGGLYGGEVVAVNDFIDTIKPKEIRNINIPIGDTLVWTSFHEKEAWSIIVSKDTTIYFNDIVNPTGFFK